jgi:hypothetical protein
MAKDGFWFTSLKRGALIFLEMIRVADARLTRSLNCRSVNLGILELHERVRANFYMFLDRSGKAFNRISLRQLSFRRLRVARGSKGYKVVWRLH